MRTLSIAVALGLAAAGTVPALALDAAGPAEQKVSGTVVAPVTGTAPGVARRAGLVSRATNGLVGHMFDVDPKTVGGVVRLVETSDPTGQGEAVVNFYSDLGDVGQGAPAEAGSAGAGSTTLVPEGTKVAMVYLTAGAAVGFTYTATEAVQVALGGASLDVTVPKNSAVRFVNDTTGPLAVTATDESFDSGELAPGAAFSQLFTDAGTFAFAVGGRTGTVTVTG